MHRLGTNADLTDAALKQERDDPGAVLGLLRELERWIPAGEIPMGADAHALHIRLAGEPMRYAGLAAPSRYQAAMAQGFLAALTHGMHRHTVEHFSHFAALSNERD